MYARRRANVAMLSPRNGPHKLRFITPDLLKYELHDVYVTGGYTLSSQEQPMSTRQIGGVQLTAYDPIWKWINSPLDVGESRDADGRTCITDNSWTITSELTLPFTGPYLLGTSVGENALTCTNDGTWGTRPVITMEGPAEDWVMVNTANGNILSWDGYSIAAGEIITIDIPDKTVTSDLVGDVTTYLSGNTGSFALEPGANPITVYIAGGVVNLTTEVSVCWYVELLGV